MRFLDLPFLPKEKVGCVMVSPEYIGRFGPALEKLGIKAVPSPVSPSLPLPVRHHPDMNCRHLGKDRFAVFRDACGTEELVRLGAELVFADVPGDPKKGRDGALNGLPLGKYFIHCPRTVSPVLQRELSGLVPVAVRQTYCACSVAPLDENTVICGDKGVSSALFALGMRVIPANHRAISLPGYSNGFIGGACGLIAPDVICFAGDPKDAVDLSLLSSLGFRHVCLDGGRLTDCGGIVPLGA